MKVFGVSWQFHTEERTVCSHVAHVSKGLDLTVMCEKVVVQPQCLSFMSNYSDRISQQHCWTSLKFFLLNRSNWLFFFQAKFPCQRLESGVHSPEGSAVSDYNRPEHLWYPSFKHQWCWWDACRAQRICNDDIHFRNSSLQTSTESFIMTTTYNLFIHL